MSNLTIQVLNNSGDSKTYYLFYQPFSGQYAPMACVTQKSTTIMENKAAIFTVEMPSAIVCGTSPNTPLAPGVNVHIEESTVVTPPQVVSIGLQGNDPYFPSIEAEATGGNWARITTTKYDSNPNTHVFCGLGIVQTSGQVTPSCVWEIDPISNYPVPDPPQPLVFYISSDPNLDVGTITTDKEAVPVATVDFTAGGTFCLVTQVSNGSFQVNPPSDNRVSGHRK